MSAHFAFRSAFFPIVSNIITVYWRYGIPLSVQARAGQRAAPCARQPLQGIASCRRATGHGSTWKGQPAPHPAPQHPSQDAKSTRILPLRHPR